MEKYSDIPIRELEAQRLAEEINTELKAGGVTEWWHPTLGRTLKIRAGSIALVTIYSDEALIGINPEIHNQIKPLLPDHMRVRMLSPERDELAMYSFHT